NLLSVIDISLLWLLLIVQQWDYLRYKLITRGWLMIPYILWVTFAAALNYSILFLN
ncbi:TPA: tryptophan-rich sensory protein, partial [Enterococcus faecalis]|nr:tryptophan-rich sensory protein [Enterococcus faecalis]